MSSPDDMPQTTDGVERASRPTNRRDFIYERRQSLLQQRQTDVLPKVNSDKSTSRQVLQLREDNKRLRRELEEMQRLVTQYKAEQAEFEKEIEAIRSGHQQELEQYQAQLDELMEESNQMQEERQQLERRYQELYHSFQDKVEEEAHKMVSEAASTLVLSPQHTPALLRDVVKTLESQLKQDEDKHVAEALYYLRETQRKAEQLEKSLEQERMQIAEERQKLLHMQYSVREQAKLRHATLESRLRTRAMLRSGITSMILLLFLLILQITLLYLKLPDTVVIIGPIFFCIGLGFLVARFYSYIIHFHASAPHKHKASAKEPS